MAVPLEVVLGSNHPDHAAYIGSNEAWDSTMPSPEANSNSMCGPCKVLQVSSRISIASGWFRLCRWIFTAWLR